MTIAIAIAVPDGIALAADTQTTWNRTILKAKQKGNKEEFELDEPIVVPVGWSKLTKKLFSLKLNEDNFAICTAGTSRLNSKTMYAIFKSLEKSYQGNSNYNEIVGYIVEGIKEQFKLQYKTIDLSKYRGKVVYLDFWASWCVPCRTEMPYLAQLWERHHDDGFRVIAINVADKLKSSRRGFERGARKAHLRQVLQNRSSSASNFQ